MVVRFIIFIFFFVFFAVHANSQNLPTRQPKSFQQCVACHGDSAQGNSDLKAPALAGQSSGYLHRQLHNFTNGLRGKHSQDIGGQQMAAIAKKLNTSEITLLVNYIATLSEPQINDEKIAGDLKNGSRYYQAKCGACHGGVAQGNNMFKAPRLAAQNYAYLTLQMANFQQGVRGTEKQDKYGRQMAMMAKTVSAKELHDILYFINQQKVK